MKFNIFDLQRFAVSYPQNPATATATSGNDYKVYVNTGTAAVPVWTIVGGQKDATLNDEYETIKTDNKTSGGAATAILGLETWDISLESMVVLNDAGSDFIKSAFRDKQQINVKFLNADGSSHQGWAWITKKPISAKVNDVATMSLTLQGNGPLTDVAAPETIAITPLIATMSLAAAADKVFTITPSSTALNVVKLNDIALTVTTDYTYSTGTLTLKSGYLDGLAVGNHVFTIDVQGLSDITVTVVITA